MGDFVRIYRLLGKIGVDNHRIDLDPEARGLRLFQGTNKIFEFFIKSLMKMSIFKVYWRMKKEGGSE